MIPTSWLAVVADLTALHCGTRILGQVDQCNVNSRPDGSALPCVTLARGIAHFPNTDGTDSDGNRVVSTSFVIDILTHADNPHEQWT